MFEKINEIIKPKKTGIEVKSIADIDKVLNHLKTPVNNKLVLELEFLDNCNASLSNLQKEIDFLDKEYTKYYSEFELIANDVQSIMQTYLADLLKVGNEVLTKNITKKKAAPLLAT